MTGIEHALPEPEPGALPVELPDDEVLYELADLFRVFGDSTRCRIICTLQIEELCVNDLSVVLNMTQSAVSHQLKILRDARLIKSRKEGRIVYYSLDDDHVSEIFTMAFQHVTEERDG